MPRERHRGYFWTRRRPDPQRVVSTSGGVTESATFSLLSHRPGRDYPLPPLSKPMNDIATNRKAKRDYHISDTYEAGIELKGTEVKSIRAGKVNLSDAYARVDKGQLWLYNCDIRPYEQASHEFHVPLRHRRLLLHKREIRKLAILTEQQGCTIVPLRLYWKNRRVKIEVGVGKGKDQRDKRQDLKEQAHKREIDREIARFNR